VGEVRQIGYSLRKLGAASRTQAVAIAIRHRLFDI